MQNIWAVGRNYADHAKELGNNATAAAGEPMIFLKAGSAAVFEDREFRLPSFSNDVHFEVEIALRFGKDLKFDAWTLACDLTARDIQNKVKSQGHPWTLPKSFKDSCLFGRWIPLEKDFDPQRLKFTMKVDGALRQSGDAQDMIHPIEKLRAYVIERFPVVPGDALITGTPAGVGKIDPGAVLLAETLDQPPKSSLKATWRATQA